MIATGCSNKEHKDDKNELLHAKSTQNSGAKKVILLIADSLMYQAIDEGIRQRSLPTFEWLTRNGQYYKDVVSSFPTMSVTIDSTLLTGTYPDKHHIPGLVWYSTEERRVINYGTGPMEIMRLGVNSVLSDGIMNLNSNHLNPRISTLYEDLEKLGLKAGSINGLVYRGNKEHLLTFPNILHVPTSLPEQLKVKGPDLLTYGVFTNPFDSEKDMPEGIMQKMGFSNKFAIEAVEHLIKSKQLPDLLLVYMPDMDHQLHVKGPSDLEGVIKLDEQLHTVLMSFGSMEEALKEAIIIVIGDSGMSQIRPTGHNPVIDLPELLKSYRVLQPDQSVTAKTEVILAVNEMMAYVYNLKSESNLRQLADILETDSRMDLIAWEENAWIHVKRVGMEGQLRFKSTGDITDRYKQTWTLAGNEQILDLKVDQDNQLVYGEYPDGLRRLSAAFHSHEGEFLIVTAKKGYELAGYSSPEHRGGGGHGSFNRTESLVPLIITGTDIQPKSHRIVDIKKYVLQLLE